MDPPQSSQAGSFPSAIPPGTHTSHPVPQLNDQNSQLLAQLQALVKAQFDQEWSRREAMYQEELKSARAARAAMEEELRKAQEAARDQSMAPPDSTQAPALPQIPSTSTPIQDRIPLPHSVASFNLPARGRSAHRETHTSMEAGPSRHAAAVRRPGQRPLERSASPLARHRSTQRPRSPSPPAPAPVPNQVHRGNSGDGDEAMEDDDLPVLRELEEELEEDDGSQEEGNAGPRDRRQDFQLKRADLPGDISGFKMAFIVHLRILWRLLHASDIPHDPSPTTLTTFDKRFHSTSSVNIQRRSSILLVAVNHVRGVRHLVESANSNSKIWRIVCKMEEHIIHYIDGYIAKFGLEEWCPDFKQSPYSLYNATHRIIAIDTFKQAVVSHAYASLKPNLKYALDIDLLQKLYNHYVHYYFYRRYSRELDNPGAVSAVDKANPNYRNRDRLCSARRDWLINNGFHRYLPLVTPKSTSDDERDPERRKVKGRPLFFIKTRPERSPHVTRLFRILDAKRENDARAAGRWRERARRDPPNGPVGTAFPTIPLGMPIDYFDPAYFNNLAPRLRVKATNSHVSLLPSIEHSFTRCEDELLSQAQFDAKYAHGRLAHYDILKEDDLMPPDEEDRQYDADAENST